MELKIAIRMENAAFGDQPEQEMARILSELAARLENGYLDLTDEGDSIPLRDHNGNKVGSAEVTA